MNQVHCVPPAKTLVWWLLLLLVGLFGCAPLGGVVPADHRVLFDQGGRGQGIFERGLLTVDYSYRLQGGELEVSGELSLRGGGDSLSLLVLLVDSTGTVLERKMVYSSGYRKHQRYWNPSGAFQATLAVPAGTAGISFDYFARPPRTYR